MTYKMGKTVSNTNGRDETLYINKTAYISLTTYANKWDMDVKRLRRYIRNHDNPPARKWDTRWLIERDAQITLPTVCPRGKSRADGRQRFVVYVDTSTTDEHTRIAAIVGVDNIVNPRERARERRMDKLADAAATDGGWDATD